MANNYGVYLDELGTWVEGFKPTKIRITHNGVDQIQCRLHDGAGAHYFLNEADLVSGQIYDLTSSGFYEIGTISMANYHGSADQFNVTNIEFFG